MNTGKRNNAIKNIEEHKMNFEIIKFNCVFQI